MNYRSIDKEAIAHSFGEAAPKYDSVAHFQRYVGEQLFARIPEGTCSRILDLGTGTGYFLNSLADLRPKQIVAGDLSLGMLQFVDQKLDSESLQSDIQLVACDAESLPFSANSFDLVFSSLAVQWCYDLSSLFSEISRILKPDGVFAYSTLLEGSLNELKQAWASVDGAQHVNDFYAAIDYQNAASDAGLRQSLHGEEKVIHYQQAIELTKELKVLGAHNMSPGRHKRLTGKARLRAFIDAYEAYRDTSGQLPATYQVGYGIAIKE